jgi:hypothetical protein
MASKVYRSTDYSIVQNRCILKSWSSRFQERPRINFGNFGTSVHPLHRWSFQERHVFGPRLRRLLPGHFGFIFDGRVETANSKGWRGIRLVKNYLTLSSDYWAQYQSTRIISNFCRDYLRDTLHGLNSQYPGLDKSLENTYPSFIRLRRWNP